MQHKLNNHFFSENETNKRKLQQLQQKFEQSEEKEHSTLAKLQECLQIVEQSQFEKHEVRSTRVTCRNRRFVRLLQAFVERDQIRIELTETQKRLKKFLEEMNETIDTEKRHAEKVCDERLRENADKVMLS